MTSKRETKGVSLFLKGLVEPVSSTRFFVKSESKPSETYVVQWDRKRWKCTCEDYKKSRRKCKHVYAVCYYLTVRDVEVGVKRLGGEAKCPVCGKNDAIIRDGYTEGKSGLKQRYYCKRCRRGFMPSTGFEGMHGQALAILIALDLYYRGLSLRQISEHLQSIYKISVSHGTIYGWIKRYVSIVSKHLSRLNVKTSERWHADDSVIRVSGRHLTVWGALDGETRLLIATHISNHKDTEEATKLLKRSLAKSQQQPMEIVTDGAKQYAKAIDETLSNIDPIIHIQAGISTPITNNKMERFYRTLKQRYKTINTFQTQETAQTFMDGFQIHYNFIKGHRALNGKTPAEAIGLTRKRTNWLDLIKKSKTKAPVL